MRHRIPRRIVLAIAAVSCARADRPAVADTTRHAAAQAAASTVCATPANGLKIGADSIGPFPIRTTFAHLDSLCALSKDSMYDAVGYQSTGRSFPFDGASVLAVYDDGSNVKPEDRLLVWKWAVIGPAIRMPDGQRLPATLGETRARFGKLLVDDLMDGDDIDGPRARLCRYPKILLLLSPKDTTRRIADSASVTSVEVEPKGDDYVRRLCAG